MTRGGCAAAALGAGVAMAGLAFCAREAGRAETARNALHARQAMQARLALEAGAIDHDLRSPVGAIAMALEVLRTTDDAATRSEVADLLERQIARMTTLTERVHALGQALAG